MSLRPRAPTPTAALTATRPRIRGRVKPAPVAAGAGDKPLYLRIAAELTAAIADGRYPVGAQLPTEIDLCGHFGISRHTAREALRVLSVAGLVSRRQRAGTVVVATPSEARFTHEARSLSDLQQYGRMSPLRFAYIGTIALSRAQAQRFGVKPGAEWIYATGVRFDTSGGRPMGVTRVFLNPVLEGIEVKLRASREAVYTLIEREYGIPIARVEQEFRGAVLDAHDAANLEVATGSPALQILRAYYDGDDRLIEYAENVHPTERFTYRMSLRK